MFDLKSVNVKLTWFSLLRKYSSKIAVVLSSLKDIDDNNNYYKCLKQDHQLICKLFIGIKATSRNQGTWYLWPRSVNFCL